MSAAKTKARNDRDRIISAVPVGGVEYSLTVACMKCSEHFTYTAINTTIGSRKNSHPKFNLKALCDKCRWRQRKGFEQQVRDGYVSDSRQAYLDAVTPGSQLAMHANSVAHPHWQKVDPLLEGIRDPADECPHERLPWDKSPPCGCWPEEAHRLAETYESSVFDPPNPGKAGKPVE